MTKNETRLFAFTILAVIAAFLIPRLLVFLGYVSDSPDAFTADQNGSLYLASNRVIRIVSRDKQIKSFPSPFEGGIDDLKWDGFHIKVYQNRKYAIVDTEGTVLERGEIPSSEQLDLEKIFKNRRSAKKVDDTVYRYHSIFGIYWITEESAKGINTRYAMPIIDSMVLIAEIKGFLDLFILIMIWNIYFIANGRFAKNGRILPPGYQGDDSFDLF